MHKKSLPELFLTFAKIGLFTFGGGYAMISVIEDICVEKKKWISHEDMMNVTVIAESTPGPIAINCATFTGYQVAKFPGALVATIGMVLPSFVIIFALSMFLEQILALPIVANAFRGIKLAVGLLILNAGIQMFQKMKKRPLALAITICAALIILAGEIFSWSISSIQLMLIAEVISIAFFLCKRKGGAA